MIRSCFIIAYILIHQFATAQISSTTKVSLITCGPGQDLYSSFGHIALRFADSSGLDKVYNYGTFDFETPNFYTKFTLGQLPYMLSVSTMDEFMYGYVIEKRWVKEQTLNLSLSEKKALFSFLENNALPENRFYHYDFYYDNCATKIRDVLEKVTQNSFTWGNDGISKPLAFRELLDLHVYRLDWVQFGFYISLGKSSDIIPSLRERLFLPDNLFIATHNAKRADGTSLVSSETDLLPENIVFSEPLFWQSPQFMGLCIIICIAFITFWEYKNKLYFKVFDVFLFLIPGFLSLLLLFLWFCTNHEVTKFNYNLLWANPLYFILFYFIKSEKWKLKALNALFYLGIILILSGVLLLFNLFPQKMYFNSAYFFIALGIRAMFCKINQLRFLNQ